MNSFYRLILFSVVLKIYIAWNKIVGRVPKAYYLRLCCVIEKKIKINKILCGSKLKIRGEFFPD